MGKPLLLLKALFEILRVVKLKMWELTYGDD
jgi:hypothetical protein